MSTFTLRNFAKQLASKTLSKFDLSIINNRRNGISFLNDLSRTDVPVKTVFDVGAHTGETTLSYLQTFPESVVHAFEPVTQNFEKLNNLDYGKRLLANKLALSNEAGVNDIHISANTMMHSLVVKEDASQAESVNVTTVDAYCHENTIDQINLLKIDAEGADLLVLKGASTMLQQQRVDFIFIETCFQNNRRHVPFTEFLNHFESLSYRFFGLYDQAMEWNGEAAVQYANACFVRQGIVFPR